MQSHVIQSFFDPVTRTVSHVVFDRASRRAAIIDSVLDFDPKSGNVSHTQADRVIAYAQSQALVVDWLLETHAHADHLSAAPYLQEKLGGKIGIGRDICTVQHVFKPFFNAQDLSTNGDEFDHLFDDGDCFYLGESEVRVLHTPGHTPACLTYLIGQDAFIGDTLFSPEYGTARCDFPGGDASTLYRSIQKILSLPADTRLHLCHDYSDNNSPNDVAVTTVAEQAALNIHLRDGVSEEAYVAMRVARDKTLAVPVLMLPAVQVNLRAGKFPPPEDNGVRYLKLPIKVL